MTDPLKDAVAQLEKQQELVQSLEADRDQWKELAQKNADKLVAAREAARELLEFLE